MIPVAAAAGGAAPWWMEYVKGLGVATVTAAGTVAAGWISKRAHPRIVQAETSERIANAFDGLVDRLQADNKRLSDRLTEAETKFQSIRKDLQERNDFIDAMRAYGRATLNYAADLETLVLRLGGVLPERPKLPDLPEPV